MMDEKTFMEALESEMNKILEPFNDELKVMIAYMMIKCMKKITEKELKRNPGYSNKPIGYCQGNLNSERT